MADEKRLPTKEANYEGANCGWLADGCGNVVLCGFAPDGVYRSPRTRDRVPAIESWQKNHAAAFGK